MIEGIELGDRTRAEAIDVGQCDRRGRSEDCPCWLNRDDEPWLLPKARDHRHLVAVDDGHTHTARFGATGKGHLPRAKR